ncbi:MAG: cytochrome c biogenesis protein ResB [Elusimicrobia bacterium]|nr:cytochrome c biogenesis protein ResB [Elusimicrobiota bacterium]
MTVPKGTFSLFRSVRFNIFLFSILAGSSALGTFLPQVGEAPEKVEAFLLAHTAWGPVLNSLGLFNVYHSFWFMGLLGLMAFDIVVCKLYKTPPDAGLNHLPPEFSVQEKPDARLEAVLDLKPYRSQWKTPQTGKALEHVLLGFFEKRRYHLEYSQSSGGVRLWVGTRHRMQRWGSYVSHVSLVVVLLGALIKTIFGFEEMVPVLEGGSKLAEHMPWEIYLDRFEVSYYPGTMTPSRFSSALRVYEKASLKRAPDGKDWYEEDPFEEGRLLAQKTILVNDPLVLPAGPGKLGRVKIYQASWGAGGMFRSVMLKIGERTLEIPQRTPTLVPGTAIRVEADMLLPSFVVAPGNRAETDSLELKNPAVRFIFHHQGNKTSPLWLFKNWPELCFAEGENGVLRHAPPPPFRLASVEPILFSGLQVGYDPGFPVVLVGSLGLLVGLSSLFYLHRRRVWVLMKPGGSGSAVLAGAWSSRGPRDFQKEFDGMMTELKVHMGSLSETDRSRKKHGELNRV